MIAGSADTIKRARKLRREMTLPEVVLWKELRARPGGYKFRRQHAAGQYILDFYCTSIRLAVEVDGLAHDSAAARKRDKARSPYLRSQGVATTRLPAKAVLSDKENVVLQLVEICDARKARIAGIRPVPLHHPADGPPPRSGEER